MKKALMGLVATVALVGSGTAARANDTTSGSTTMKRETTYDSKTSDTAFNKSGALSNELTGRVVKTDNGTVWVEHMGAVIPFKVDKSTRFDGAGITQTKDLKEGQQIRTSFMVNNKTDNLAKSIALSATGGSGLDSNFNYGKSVPDTKSGIDTTSPVQDDKTLNNNMNNNLPNDGNTPSKTY